jgi:hypothetical protein
LTSLACLADDKNFTETINDTANLLLRGMKGKEYRGLCLRCAAVVTRALTTTLVGSWLASRPLLATSCES